MYSAVTNLTLVINESRISLGNKVKLIPTILENGTNNKITTGSVEFYLSDGTYIGTKTISNNGDATFEYEPKKTGDFEFYAKYVPDDTKSEFYTPDQSNLVYLNVFKELVKTNVTIFVTNETYSKQATATITTDVAGSYSIIINNRKYDNVTFTTEDVKNGKASKTVTVDLLDAKNGYEASVSFSGNDEFKPASDNTLFSIYKSTSSIDVDGQTITYGGTVDITAVIVNSTGVSGATLYKDGQPYNAVTPIISGDKITITNLPRGKYTLNATTDGDSNHNSSWDTCSIIVNPAGSEVVVPEKEVEYKKPVVLDIGGENTTGISKIEIFDENDNPVSFTNQTNGKQVTITGLDAGNYTVIITNKVDENHTQNTGKASLNITKAPSSINVPNSEITYGETVSVTVNTVNSTGDVEVHIYDSKDNEIKTAVVEVSGNDITIKGLDAGEYKLNVTTKVDGNHKAATNTGNIKVNQAPSTVNASDITVVYDENNNIAVKVNAVNATSVDYTIEGTDIRGTVNDANDWTIELGSLDVNNYTIKLTTNVDGNHKSVTNESHVNVTQANSTVKSQDVEKVYGEPVSVEVESTHASKITYVIYNETGIVEEGEIEAGNPIVVVKTLDYGVYTVNVTTTPSSSNYAVSKNQSKITVNKSPATVVVTGDEISYGQDATIKVEFTGTTNGTYEILDGDKVIKTGEISDNEIITGLKAGNYTVHVTPNVDKNHYPVMGESSINVTKVKSDVNVTGDEIIYGENATVKTNFTGATNGTYQIIDNETKKVIREGNITDEVNITDLPAGNYTVKVTTNPDENHTEVTKEATITVSKAPSTVNVTDVTINHGEKVNTTADAKNATGVSYVVLKGDEPIKYGEDDNLTIIIEGLEPGEYTLNVTTKVDANHTEASKTSKITVIPVVDLEITKKVDKTEVQVGQNITYTIEVVNRGPSRATNVTVTESLSGLVKVVDFGDAKYDNKTNVWSVGDLDKNAHAVLTLVVEVIDNGTVENFVSVKSNETDSNETNNNATSNNVTAEPVADIVITKKVDKTEVQVGDEITFNITVKNNGPSKATDVKVAEELSDLVNLTQAVKDYDGKVWTVGDLAKGESKELILVVKVIGNGTISNNVTVTSKEEDTNKTNNNDTSDNVTAKPVVDLEITKTIKGNITSVLVGDEITYVISVKNNGPSNATDVKVSEKLSKLVKLIRDVEDYDGNVWTVGNLAKGETKELTLVVKVIGNGTISNNVGVTSKENDTNKSNNNASSPDVEAKPLVILNITKVADVETANVGENITYTITVTNNGLSNATGVKVTENLSPLVKVVDFGDAKYDKSSNVWTVGDLAVNKTATLRLVVEVIANGTVENSASVTSKENDTVKNVTSYNVTARPVVDLEITKKVDRTVANVGENITYTITVTNKGPSKATGVKVNESLSDLVKVVDFGNAKYDKSTNVWTVGDLDVNATATLELVVVIINNGTVENSVFVKSTENDTNMSNNNATSDNVTVHPVVDLEISKSVDKTTANVGDTLTYKIVVKNNGPSKATDVKVAEKLSDLVELTEDVDGYDGKVWTVGEIEAGMNATLTLTVKVIGNGTIMNNVSVSSKENDSDKNNNNDAADNVTARPVVDLEITKVVDKTTANVGDTLTYTIVVKNNGPCVATGVKVSENIDLDLVRVISASGNYDSKTNVWSVDSISSGKNATFTLTVEIIANGTVKNSVSVKSNENDTDKTNNNASSNDTDAKPVVDLEITKTVNVTSALVGDEIAYTIVVKNNGPSKATYIKVSEKLSNLVELVSAVSSAGKFENNVWSIDSLESDQNATLTLTVKLIKDGIAENSVSVTSKENDSDMSNNNATSDNVTSIPNADLSIIKTVNTTSAKIGQSIEYTIVVKNNGPSTATNVSVDEKLSELVEFVSADGDYDSKTGLWNVGTLENGANATLTLIVKLIRDGTVENNVTVNANEKDANETNNNYTSDNVTARPVVNLIANVTVNDTTPTYGDVIEFAISITNDGPSNATNVTVENAIPEGLKNATVVVSQGSFDETTGQWNVGTVNVGDNPVLTIIGTVKTLEPFDDYVEITHFEERDEELEDNNATSEEVKPQPIVDVEISINVDRSEVNYGDSVEFVITVHNNGPNDAREVYVENVIPQGFVYVSDNISNSNYQKDKLMASASTPSFDASTATWYVGDLANGSSASLALLLRANYLGTKDVKSSVSAAENETDYTNNNASASVKVNPVVDLEVKVSVDKTKIKSGEKVTYTIVVINHGPNDATGVEVTDEGLTKLQHVRSTSDAYDPETGVWEVGNLTIGSSKTLKVTVIIQKAGVYPNSAGVSSNENDTDMTNNNATSDDVNVTDEEPVDEPVKEKNTTHVAKAHEIKTPVLHETGNPILMLLLVLATSIVIPLRRRK